MKTVLSLLAIALAAACTLPMQGDPGPERGALLFASECAACHGADARGAEVGPALTSLTQANEGIFPRDFVMTTIDGYTRGAGHPMPIFGADPGLGPTLVVEDDAGVGTPVPADLLALTAFLESVQD